MTIDLLAATFSANPYQEYDLIRASAPCYYDQAAHSYVVADHEGVSQLLSQQAVTPYFHIWEDGHSENFKAIEADPFSINKSIQVQGLPALESVIPLIEKNIQNLLSRISGGIGFDIIRQFSSLLPFGIFADLTGISRTDIPRLQHWYSTHHEALNNIERNPDVGLNSENSRQEMSRYFDRVSEYTEPGQALFDWPALNKQRDSALGALLMEGGMHFEEGFARFMLYLSQHEGLRKQSMENEDLALTILKEVYRCYAPRPILMMQNQEKIAIGDMGIPRGSRIILLISAANRDPNVFPQVNKPDVSYSETTNRQVFSGYQQPVSNAFTEYHLFGARLSALTALIASRQIFSKFPNLKFPEAENWVKSRSLVAQLVRV